MSPSDALTPNLLGDWLDYLGIQTCTCEYAWRGLGVLYGQSFGKGWVRTGTAPDCPHHPGGGGQQSTAVIPNRQRED